MFIYLLEQSSPMENIEILLHSAVVEGDYLHKVLDKGKLWGEMWQRNEAEVLILILLQKDTRKDNQTSFITKFLL